MVHRTAIIVATTTILAAQFLPFKYAFIIGAFLVMLPLRLTIMPGNFISQTAMGTSLLSLFGLYVGMHPFVAFLFGVTGRAILLITITSYFLKSSNMKSSKKKPRLPKFMRSNKVQPTVMKQYPAQEQGKTSL
ncbi:hypothetical protein ACFLQI_02745 [Candidatus Undinarchaeota archaeon]